MQSQRKHIVIVMDHGNSLSGNQLRTAKGITRNILSSLSEKDRVRLQKLMYTCSVVESMAPIAMAKSFLPSILRDFYVAIVLNI